MPPATTPPPTPPHDPFTPFDIGPANAAWAYEDLTPEEQAVADRGATEPGWDHINQVYAGAVKEHAAKFQAEIAARKLGIDHLGEIGVVP